jgi:hypothetical protein
VSVTVNREPLAAGQLGLHTVGEVLGYLQRQRQIVVQMLIDGAEPDTDDLRSLSQTRLVGHTVYIETADPRRLALEVLDAVHAELPEAQRLKEAAADLLARNQQARALEHLAGCIRIWQQAQEAMAKVAQLLRVDLGAISLEGTPLERVLARFAEQLRAVRSALEQRDYVSLGDALVYEMQTASQDWGKAIDAMRQLVQALR